MASLQDIRRRIKSVKSIQQITKAMKMVAAARLRRAQQAAVANKPYAEKMAQIVENAASAAGDFAHPLLKVHHGSKRLYLVIASDKGLAGAYASNIFKEVAPQIEDKSAADIIAIGRKAVDYFSSRGYNVVNKYIGISERPTFEWAKQISEDIAARYDTGEYSDVQLVFSRFVSAIQTVPETHQLLPFSGLAEKASPKTLISDAAGAVSADKAALQSRATGYGSSSGRRSGGSASDMTRWTSSVAQGSERQEAAENAADDLPKDVIPEEMESAEPEPIESLEPLAPLEPLEPLPPLDDLPFADDLAPLEEPEVYIFEPSAATVLGYLLPQYLITTIYGAELQAAASELSSRMTAMSNATDNAEELIKKLDLHYNKVRQGKITSEINEIVGGAEALK